MATPPDGVRDRIARQLTAPLGALGLDLEALELTPAGKRRVLRIAVDGDDGVNLDAVAEATRAVSQVLDDDPICQAALGELAYTLEVTSRGVDRPLTLPRHWRRNRTRLVRATLTGAEEETVTGRVLDSGESTVTLDVDGAVREIAYDRIENALVQVEFNRRPTPTDQDTDQDTEKD